jgi:hypothetical protein
VVNMNVSFQSRCDLCTQGATTGWSARTKRFVHPIPNTRNEFVACKNFDSEQRWLGDSLGYYVFAWRPRKCRNGKWRWLTWLERHTDWGGRTYYTLGNRAH